MYPSPVTVVFVDIPPCVAPTPVSPSLWIPSTNISSPILNGWISNPLIGVSRKQVTTPELLVWSELIPTPFELLIAIILWTTESNPDTGANTSTCDIVWFGVTACKDTSSTIVFDTGLNTIKLGALIYSAPPSTTSTLLITSKLLILSTGETNASGLNVLSDEYSYPKSIILTFLILPIDFDVAIIFASEPSVLLTVLNSGNFL